MKGIQTIEKKENNQIIDIDIILAFLGMVFDSLYSRINFPNIRLLMTKLYSFSDDLIKQATAIIKNIVPGNPGSKYPNIPNTKHINPIVRKISFLISKNKFFAINNNH